MRLIIDGSNVILYQILLAELGIDENDSRRWWVGWHWLNKHLIHIVDAIEKVSIVYDSEDPRYEEKGRHPYRNVSTRFVKDADAKIVVSVRKLVKAGNEVCVVTDDQELQTRCTLAGAEILPSRSFIELLVELERLAHPISAEEVVGKLRCMTTMEEQGVITIDWCKENCSCGSGHTNEGKGVFILGREISAMLEMAELTLPHELVGYEFAVLVCDNTNKDHLDVTPFMVKDKGVEGVVSVPEESASAHRAHLSNGNGGTRAVTPPRTDGYSKRVTLGNLGRFGTLAPRQSPGMSVYLIKPTDDNTLTPGETGYIEARVYHPEVEMTPEQEALADQRRALLSDSRLVTSEATKQFLRAQIADLDAKLVGIRESEFGLTSRPALVTFFSKDPSGGFPYLEIRPLEIDDAQAAELPVLNVVPVGCGSSFRAYAISGTWLFNSYFGKPKIGQGAYLATVNSKRGGCIFVDGVEVIGASSPCLAKIRIAPDGTPSARFFQEVLEGEGDEADPFSEECEEDVGAK